MGGGVDPTGSDNRVQPVVSEAPVQKAAKPGKFKRWRTKGVELIKSVWSKTKKKPYSDLPRAPKGIELQRISSVEGRVISQLSDKRPGVQRQVSVEYPEIRTLLEKRPDSIEDCKVLIRTLEVKWDGLLKEETGISKDVLQQINNRIGVLRGCLISSTSSYHECQLKKLETEAALDLVPESGGRGMMELRAELTSRIQRLHDVSRRVSQTDRLTKGGVSSLAQYPEKLVKTMDEAGLKVTAKDIKKSVVARLNREQWHEVSKPGCVMANGREYRFQQQCTPGCRITGSKRAAGESGPGQKEEASGIFPEDYRGLGVTSHATQNTVHATNLFTSRLVDQATGQEDLAIVRHGVNSPYGVKPGNARSEGALNRAKEVVVSALTLKPELLEKAVRGEAVTLVMTSNSLLTPDPFRQLIEPSGDERPMLEDQLNAYKALCREQPVTLKIRTPGGRLRDIRVNLELIPFNFGVNKFAVDAPLDIFGGWDYSDSVNSEGLQRLIGSTIPGSGDGGLVGRWLQRHEGHPDAGVVRTLMKQVREIYSSQAHRSLEGGAYKLTSRLVVLTWLMGGVPCTNCKSGKDRTSMSVATAEALIAHIRLYGKVPAWREVSDDQSHLVKEFCLQGGHHEIQRMNTGVPGFKIQKEVLRGYGMNESEIAQVRGLSDQWH